MLTDSYFSTIISSVADDTLFDLYEAISNVIDMQAGSISAENLQLFRDADPEFDDACTLSLLVSSEMNHRHLFDI